MSTASHLLAPRHGHSCSAIGDTLSCDATAPSSSNDSLQPNVNYHEYDEADIRECIPSEPGSRQFGAVEPPETGWHNSESVRVLPGADQRRSTSEGVLKTSRSSQSLDVAITVEVCDADTVEDTPYRACQMNIPPVTISSATSSPDDEPGDQRYVVAMISPNEDRSSPFTSVLSSPAARSHSAVSDDNPNFLSVSRAGTFSSCSGASTRSCSRRTSSHHSVVDVEPHDVISVDGVGV